MNPIRLSIYYAAYFGVIGILLPFWPVWLEAQGLSSIEIGLTLASAPFVRSVASPLLAQIADRQGLRPPIIILLTAATYIMHR